MKPKFLVDECTGPQVAEWLKTQGFSVYSVSEERPGMDDSKIIAKALREKWIVITNDKDFGELVYREKQVHHGIIFLRLEDERPQNKIKALRKFLESFKGNLSGRFFVVHEDCVRVAHDF